MSSSPEKKRESYDEDAGPVLSENGGYEVLRPEVRQAAERRLVRKLDFRLLPTIVVIFLMNYIDRVAVTAARLKGLEAALGLTGMLFSGVGLGWGRLTKATDIQYDTVVAILYASYCPAQIPSNMILNYVTRPTFYIGTCVVLWGLTSALTGVAKNFAGIMACRVFIGLPEAAFYPGAIYLLSRWYTRKELAFRSAILYAGLLVSNAFGSRILGNMDGMMGIAGWRWLFYIEGAITIFVGVMAMWLLPDYRHLAQVRLAEDAGEADQDSQDASIFEGLLMAIKDRKVLIFMLMTCSQLLGLSFVNFFPTLTSTLGYSTTATLLMAAPPWIPCNNFYSHQRMERRTGERFFHMTAWWWVVMVGYIISCLRWPLQVDTSRCFTLTLVWVANAIPRPPAKRSAAIGLVNGFGNLGNLMGSYIWKANWSPKYHQSMIIALCALAFASFLSFGKAIFFVPDSEFVAEWTLIVVRTMLVRENKRMEQQEMDLMNGPERERIEEAAEARGNYFRGSSQGVSRLSVSAQQKLELDQVEGRAL
ncbi:major facilitator superfamily domain-containing protein [Melanogaster broomeanus]|nr:major facilitator superfamily domain-containing protein [Melanogaster broomeanus]